MKYKIERRFTPTTHTLNGIPAEINRRSEVRVPVLPRDWDAIGIRVAVGVVMTLTLITVTWSTVSIGGLLQGGVGYAAAVVFDAAWGVCIILEWLSRFDPARRQFPHRLGWFLLAATMGAIGWSGLLHHDVALAVVGAVVSLFTKILWAGVLQHIDRHLSDDDQQWVSAQISEANASMAIASVRRQAARLQSNAAAELLAMEAANGYFAEAGTPAVRQAGRRQDTLSRAVSAILADASGRTLNSTEDICDEASKALDAAQEDGWTVREVYSRAMHVRRERREFRELIDAAVASGRMSPDARTDEAYQQVTGPQVPPDVRAEGGGARVPEQPSAVSLAEAVRVLTAGGMGREQMLQVLPGMVGRPFQPESVDREIRAAKARLKGAPSPGFGFTNGS